MTATPVARSLAPAVPDPAETTQRPRPVSIAPVSPAPVSPAPVSTAPVSTAPVAGRRALLRGAAVASAAVTASAATAPLTAVPAFSAGARPALYRGHPLLSHRGRHLVTRFSYGLTPAMARGIKRRGGARRWFERQLRPDRIPDPAARALAGWWPSLRKSPQQLWQGEITGSQSGWDAMLDYQRWLMMRRIKSQRQVHEVMTEFWMNHLNVPVHADGVFTYRFSYDQVVRRHALGSFSDLLEAAITHPAMSIFLNNATSTKEHPNENLGRELLELHTVGRGARYTEDDVKNSARILTGYRVDMWNTWRAQYHPESHYTGPVEVLGFRHANGAADGRAVARAYLRYLARHPQTAERIVRKLATKFVRDEPPESLIRHLVGVYRRHDTAIKPVLRALISSKAFRDSAGWKVREPAEDVVATYRALRVKVGRPGNPAEGRAAVAVLWQADNVGQIPQDWPRPDGPPLDNQAWSSPSRMLASMAMHWGMAGGVNGWGWPNLGIEYHGRMAWMPKRRIRFDQLVDSLSQQILGRHATPTLLKACCEAARCRPKEIITAEHGLIRSEFPRLLTTFLDSPYFMSR